MLRVSAALRADCSRGLVKLPDAEKTRRAELAPARIDEYCPVRISFCDIISGYLVSEGWVLIQSDYVWSSRGNNQMQWPEVECAAGDSLIPAGVQELAARRTTNHRGQRVPRLVSLKRRQREPFESFHMPPLSSQFIGRL